MSERSPLDPRDAARLSAWFDGELGEVESAEARERLLDDPAARAQIQEWRALREDLQALQPEPLAAARLDALRTRLAVRGARDAAGLERAVRAWSIAAALLLVVGLGWSLGDRWLGPGPGVPAYASEPRDFERAITELLDPSKDPPGAAGEPGPLRKKWRNVRQAPAAPAADQAGAE